MKEFSYKTNAGDLVEVEYISISGVETFEEDPSLSGLTSYQIILNTIWQ